MARFSRHWLALLLVLLIVSNANASGDSTPAPDFRFEIRPILSKNCFSCHGPDEAHREADLRLDIRDVAIDSRAIVPGSPDDSELVRRITTEDESERMPPSESGHDLSVDEIDKIVRWIAAGAKYSKHWSYEPPKRPPLPTVSRPEWCRNAIDDFILAALDKAGLKPEPEADRHRLIRRLSLDLIGLPPTPEEVDAFVRDKRPDAYERVVDRLLRSPAYGEHWAVKWLDLARYADTCGYEKDSRRTIWPFRDWVINALNDDMPFDNFTIEQLAGDLLPNPTQKQLVATAFHRNTMQNDEGGTDDEEFRVAAVVDRVNTTMQVWMGTTMGCCQCHSHKYDPLSQREYYELFAFFNQTADEDRFDQEPTLLTPSEEQRRLKVDLERQLAEWQRKYKTQIEASSAGQRSWEEAIAAEVEWQPLLVVDANVDAGTYTSHGRSELRRITALRLEVLPQPMSEADDTGKTPTDGNVVVSRLRVIPESPVRPIEKVKYVHVELPDRHDYLAIAEVQVFRGDENVALGGTARQSSTAYEGPAEYAIDGRTDGHFATGRSVTHTSFEYNPWWEVSLAEPTSVDRIVLWNRDEFSHRLGNSRVTLLDANRKPIWRQTVVFAPDLSATLITSGSNPPALAFAGADSQAQGFPARYAIENHDPTSHGWSPDTESPGPHWLTVGFERPIEADGPLELTVMVDQQLQPANGRDKSLEQFRLLVTDDPRAADTATVPPAIRKAASTSIAERTEAQTKRLTDYYRSVSPELKRIAEERADIERRLTEGLQLEKTPIMKELPQAERRITHIHQRGNFLDPGEVVEPATPAVFPAIPVDAPRDRLGLAKWLVDRQNPLTARVAANRQWEQLIGTGIVLTSEDFGSQGTLPSHPELLDWLAVELMEKDWSMKHLTKTIVMSAAYRQSSRLTPEKLERDPTNRLVSHGPRGRLTAEQLRDQALFVSGMLSRKMFGPSVMPRQPEGVWEVVYSDDHWQPSQGDDRYRRGLYTFWRRTSPYPSAMALDATSRETCTIRRVPTNTPVAAFALLNDPVYIEAAQALARTIKTHSNLGAAEGIAYAFRRVLSRPPTPAELQRLVSLYESLREYYSQHRSAATKLATSEFGPTSASSSMADLAAWTVVGNVLLNLDETLTK